MSFYTDFIVADETDVATVAAEEFPTDRWAGVSVKGITELDLANLWAILSRGADPASLHARFEYVDCDVESARPLNRVSHPLLELLSGLPKEGLEGLAAHWACAEEFRGMKDFSHLTDLLGDLRRLATQTLDERLVMLICVSGC